MRVSIYKVSAFMLVAVMLLAGQALAASIPLANPSFEEGDGGHTAVAGWTLPGCELGANGGLFGKQNITGGVGSQWNSTSDGNSAAFFNGSYEILQETSAVIQEGITYTLQVDLGQRMDFDDTWGTFNLSLYAKGEGETSLTYLKGLQAYRESVPEGGWRTVTLTYVANVPSEYGKKLVIKLENPGDLQPWIDNVRLSDSQVNSITTLAPVPLSNPSFEEGEGGHSAVGGWTLPGWELSPISGLAGKQDISSGIGTMFNSIPDGNCAAFFNSEFRLLQTTPVVIKQGERYVMRVNMSQRMDMQGDWSNFYLWFFAKGPTDESPILLTSSTISAASVPSGDWGVYELSWLAALPAAVGKNLIIGLQNGSGIQPWLDNVRLYREVTLPAIALNNPSFELGDPGHSAIDGWVLPGWELGYNGGLGGKQNISGGIGAQWNSTSDGNSAAFFNGSFEITQLTDTQIGLGDTFMMQVDLGQRMDFDDNWTKFNLSFYAKGDTDPSPIYLGGQQYDISAVPQGGWRTVEYIHTVVNTAAIGKKLYIKLENPGGLQPWIDNVKVGCLKASEVYEAKSISEVKSSPNAAMVSTSGIITASFPDVFYIESADRSNGIRVAKEGHGLQVGYKATIDGIMTTLASGERCINAVSATETLDTELKPLAMSNKALGGGDTIPSGQVGVVNGSGLNNIGLLVRTTGKVMDYDRVNWPIQWVEITDGSGVLVRVEFTEEIWFAYFDQYIAVTGISSCCTVDGLDGIQRKVLVRTQDDITLIQ